MPCNLAAIFMKWHFLLFGSCALVLSSCETGEVVTQGEFDPLVAPGANRSAVSTRSGYKPGAFVRTNMDNVAFFTNKPKGDASADKTLAGNTEMKVIADDGSYVKVELNSGEVGYVPTVQVTDQSSSLAPLSSGNEIQLYPPPPGSVPPVVDPNAPPTPSVIDPDAPVVVPEVTPAPADAPVVPPSEPTPLPPGNEAEDTPVEGN
jgi:hypothetical protein